MKIKSIGVKLTASIIALLFITCISLGIFSYFNSSKALKEQVETNLVWKAEDVSHYIEEFFKRTYIEIEGIAEQSVVQSMDSQQQFSFLNKRIEGSEDYLAFGIVDESGTSHYSDGTTADLSDRDYIKNAFNGETSMSDIIISRVTNEPVIMVATPINTRTGENALLIARLDGYMFSEVVESITVGETGYALIVNEDGTIQGHKKTEHVKNQVNFLAQAKETGEMTGEAKAIEEILSNEAGFYEFKHSNGDDQYIGYHTLDNGWSMAVTAVKSEMLAGLDELKRNLVISTVVMLIIGLGFALFVTRSLSRPIKELVQMSEHLAKGDFTHEVPKTYRKRQDELGILARSLSKTVGSMRDMIKQVNKSSDAVNDASCELIEDVNKVTSMTDTITNAIAEVERGSVTQAKMADEGAMAMEQMAVGIQQVAEVASTVAEHTQTIEEQINNGHQAVQDSIRQMTAIQSGTETELEVIHKLEAESNEIGLISNMITDISDQTNLLALNASIEAARAGEAGKGFAVVADEVRKLSEQTAESASKINTLIQNVQGYTGQVVKAAESGEENVMKGLQTIDSLEQRFGDIVESVKNITRQIEQLSASAQQMSANTEEVTASMEEMSATATSSSEYIHEVTKSTAAQHDTVEEMSNQATELSEMAKALRIAVSQFKL
ncbi:methyl-accepting chemotaxis protein [Lysinibacillus sp. 54212]|uniref:methyl-accepting chemotaxis protein n=1 Tax=Lysinibacillus sp. 54212 TaxID=3119829 RepID=UPI002FC6BC07